MENALEGAAEAVAEPAAAPAPAPEPVDHRADAAQAFMSGWLPAHAVAAGAFTQADAKALLVAIDAGAKAAA
jgi:hypothetical protein